MSLFSAVRHRSFTNTQMLYDVAWETPMDVGLSGNVWVCV